MQSNDYVVINPEGKFLSRWGINSEGNVEFRWVEEFPSARLFNAKEIKGFAGNEGLTGCKAVQGYGSDEENVVVL